VSGKPCKSDLVESSGDLYYELAMLCHTARLLEQGHRFRNLGPRDVRAVECALLESFLVHVRSLAAFGYHDQTRQKLWKTDLRASWYVDGSVWESERPCLDKAIICGLREECGARIHKDLAHLTLTRLRGRSEWPTMKMAYSLFRAMEVFARLAHPNGILSEEWDSLPQLPSKEQNPSAYLRMHNTTGGDGLVTIIEVKPSR